MTKLRQYETIQIRDFEEAVYHLPAHGHTYFELIYIYSGSGMHMLNDSILPYEPGDVYLISPEDQHHFQIDVITRFIMIKFTDNYFKHQHHTSFDEGFSIVPEAIMRQKLYKEVKLQFDELYATLIKQAFENIVLYNSIKSLASSPYVYQQLLSIFGIIKEAAPKLAERIDNGTPDKEALISYIHEHIYNPEAFAIKNIAAHFNISRNYFGAYFRRNFGISYREYTNQYRGKLIERRITGGQVSMKQIATEFGFTDESHLSNYFKKQRNIRPTVFRGQVSAV